MGRHKKGQRHNGRPAPQPEPRRSATAVAPAVAVSAPAGRLPRPTTIALCVVLVALTLFVYLPVRHHGFVLLDDTLYVSENPHLTGGITWDAVAWAFTTGRAANWHPVTWVSHLVDVQLFDLNAGAHHATNVILHLLNVVLLFGVLYGMTGARVRSAIVAALFAVHPMHVESVAWISERKDVLSALFWFLTILAYVAYVRRGGWSRFALAIVAFAIGLMAKPMLVTLPLVLLLLDRWPLGRIPAVPRASGWGARVRAWLPFVREKIPFMALAAISSVVTYLVQQHGGAMADLQHNALGRRIVAALAAYLTYLAKTVWPSGLSVFYPYPRTLPVSSAVAGLLVLVVVSVAVVRLAGRRPWFAVGWFWFVITLVPVIGIVQVGLQATADRYTYLPHIGLFIAAVWGVAELVTRSFARRLTVAAAFAIVVAFASLARAQVATWENSETLWRHALAVNPDDYFAHDGLGILLRGRGQTDAAIGHFREAIRLAPGDPDSHLNLGLAFEIQGRTDAAIEQYRLALQLKPSYALAHINLGTLLLDRGDVDEALQHCREALRLDPELGKAHLNIAKALVRRGKSDEAIAEYREALRLAPDDVQAIMAFGQALCSLGRTEEGVQQFRTAVRLAPASADAHNNVGVALAATGRLDEALPEYREALRLDARRADVRENLGSALARQGRMQDAIAEFSEALRLGADRASLHQNLGFALGAAGRVAEAIPHFEQAVRLEPDSEVSHLYLAMALAGTGMLERAAMEYREVLRINPHNEKALQDLERITRSGGIRSGPSARRGSQATGR